MSFFEFINNSSRLHPTPLLLPRYPLLKNLGPYIKFALSNKLKNKVQLLFTRYQVQFSIFDFTDFDILYSLFNIHYSLIYIPPIVFEISKAHPPVSQLQALPQL
jgi:hypothetical protein